MSRRTRLPKGPGPGQRANRIALGGRLKTESEIRPFWHPVGPTGTYAIPGLHTPVWWYSSSTYHTGSRPGPSYDPGGWSGSAPPWEHVADPKGNFDGWVSVPSNVGYRLAPSFKLDHSEHFAVLGLPKSSELDLHATFDGTLPSEATWNGIPGAFSEDSGAQTPNQDGWHGSPYIPWDTDTPPTPRDLIRQGDVAFSVTARYTSRTYPFPPSYVVELESQYRTSSRWIYWPYLGGSGAGSMTVFVGNHIWEDSFMDLPHPTIEPAPGVEFGSWYYRDVDTSVTLVPGLATFSLVAMGGYNYATAHIGLWYRWTGASGHTYGLYTYGNSSEGCGHGVTYRYQGILFDRQPYSMTRDQAFVSLRQQLCPGNRIYGYETGATNFCYWWQTHWQDYLEYL